MSTKRKKNRMHLEKQMLPKLNMLGFILLFFSLCSLVYAFYAHRDVSMDTPPLQYAMQEEGVSIDLIVNEYDLSAAPPEYFLNFYLISTIFASVGTLCFIISKNKNANLVNINRK